MKRQVRDSNVLVDRKKKNIGKETIKENLLKKGNVQVFDKKIH